MKDKSLSLQKESRPFEKNVINAGSAHIVKMMSKFLLETKIVRESNLIIKPPKYKEKVIIFYLLILSQPKEALWQKNVKSKAVALSL